MDRRTFTCHAAGALGALLAGRPTTAPAMWGSTVPIPPQGLRIDGPRLNATLGHLAGFGRTGEGGISRVAFSPADREARTYVAGLLREAGFDVEVDAAANLVARKAGTAPLRPIMLGSHLDSVPEGGNFDGQVGSMGAVEVARTLADAGHRTRHPLEVVVFANEEGGKTGSRAMAGEVEAFELDLMTASGLTIGEGLRANGGDPSRLDEARRESGSLRAFLELHVEQGGVLHRRGIPIGIVEGIVGIRRWEITVEGFANHAGTTPMDARQDALVGAAGLVEAVHRVAREMEGTQVATVGRIHAEPGAPNVIPGRVSASLEIRDLAMAKIDRVFDAIESEARAIAAATDVTIGFEPFYLSRAAPTDEGIRRLIAETASSLDLETLTMPSGAGHDAQSIARLAPIGMIFVPSVDGISHSPQEYSRPQDITAGADVLLGTLLRLDRG